MVLDSFSASYIGWPTSRFVSLMIDNDKGGARRARALLACSEGLKNAEPSSLELC